MLSGRVRQYAAEALQELLGANGEAVPDIKYLDPQAIVAGLKRMEQASLPYASVKKLHSTISMLRNGGHWPD